MQRKQSRAEKIADKRIEAAYYAECSGAQINIMDIPKVFAFGHEKIAAGSDDATLRAEIKAFVGRIAQ